MVMTNQQPEIAHREPQPYAAIGGTVTMDQVVRSLTGFPRCSTPLHGTDGRPAVRPFCGTA